MRGLWRPLLCKGLMNGAINSSHLSEPLQSIATAYWTPLSPQATHGAWTSCTHVLMRVPILATTFLSLRIWTDQPRTGSLEPVAICNIFWIPASLNAGIQFQTFFSGMASGKGRKVSKQTCMRLTQRLIAEAPIYRCAICISIPNIPLSFLFRLTVEVGFPIWMSEQRYNTDCGKYLK